MVLDDSRLISYSGRHKFGSAVIDVTSLKDYVEVDLNFLIASYGCQDVQVDRHT